MTGPTEPTPATGPAEPGASIRDRLLALFRDHGATIRLVDHAPEGRTELVSQLRGNELRQAAKAMVVMVKLGKKDRRYFLCVVPGDCRLDMEAVKQLANGTHVLLAPGDVAAKLTSCVSGAIPPVSFHPDLELVVDPRLLDNDAIVFNAGCLEQSMFVDREAYVRAASPAIASIGLPSA